MSTRREFLRTTALGAGGRGSEAIALAVRVFGADRIVFGTDYAPAPSVAPVRENILRSPADRRRAARRLHRDAAPAAGGERGEAGLSPARPWPSAGEARAGTFSKLSTVQKSAVLTFVIGGSCGVLAAPGQDAPSCNAA